jgi:uncharacterized membrane protein YciS (DUF1049 family)
MGLIKWVILFVITLALAFVVILTFSQPPFHQTASAVIFFYQTKAYPLYLWVAAALGLGLAFGIIIALYYYITLKSAAFSKDRIIKSLREELDTIKAQHVSPIQPPPSQTEQIQQ